MADDVDNVSASAAHPAVGRVGVGHHASGIAVVTMSGEHDLSTQPVLAHALELAAAHSNVIVDLTDCSFIDSTIIREFTQLSERLRARSEHVILVIPAEQAAVARVVEMVGLSQFLQVHETTGAAVASLHGTSHS